MTTMSRLVGKTKLSLIKNAPTLSIGAGVVGLLGAVYLSGKAAIKTQDILAEHREEMKQEDEAYQEVIVTRKDNPEAYPEITEQTHNTAKLSISMQTGVKVLKAYGPTLAIAGLSIASIIYGRNIFQKRLTSLAAALQITTATLERYRTAVAEETGEEKEAEIYKSATQKHLERMANQIDSLEEFDAARSKVSRTAFARWFDQTNSLWTNQPGENRFLIANSQNYFNDLLRRRGYVFLNEVYTHLGFQPVPEGQTMGWIHNSDHPDTVIDFDVFNSQSSESRAFVNDLTPNVLLDFHGVTYILGDL